MGLSTDVSQANAVEHLRSGVQRGAEEESVLSKPWGTSTAVVLSDQVQIELIRVRRGGYSSPHEHLHKLNLFLVLEGRLKISIFEFQSGSLQWCDQHVLTPGKEALIVAARKPHQFVCLEECVAYEVYWPIPGQAVTRDDIRRYGVNGMLPELAELPSTGVVSAPAFPDRGNQLRESS